MDNLRKYITHVDGVTSYGRSLSRIKGVVGDAMPESLAKHASQPVAIPYGIATAAGAVAGGIIGYKHGHTLLGAISGGSLFTNGPALLKANTRNEAFWNLAQTHGGVFASLAMKDNKAFGFVLGWVAVGVARYLYGGGQ